MSSHDIVRTYKKNEFKGDNLYKGKYMGITGRLDRVAEDLGGEPFLTIKAGRSSFRSVQCFFENKDREMLSKLNPNSKILAIGKVRGLFANVILDDCYFSDELDERYGYKR